MIIWQLSITDSIQYIYIFIAIALDETSILVALHFSMQNIYQSYDLATPWGGATSTSASNFFVYWRLRGVGLASPWR